MSKIENIAADLARCTGSDTEGRLAQIRWDDAVGQNIKEKIEYIVKLSMDGARHHYAQNLGSIKTEDIENALRIAQAHARS